MNENREELYYTIETKEDGICFTSYGGYPYEEVVEVANNLARETGKNVRIVKHEVVYVVTSATKETIERYGL